MNTKEMEDIARRAFNIPTLAEQGSDRLDFHDVSASQVKNALTAAFALGVQEGVALIKEDKINGCRVLASFSLPREEGLRPSRIVMVEREGETVHPFVVAMHCGQDAEWVGGRYCKTREMASAVFLDRVTVSLGLPSPYCSIGQEVG